MDNASVFRRPAHAPDTLARPEHWGRHAVCRDEFVPRDVFFPEDFSGAEAIAAAETAKAYCRRCSVLEDCLRDALTRGEPFGVWGGTTAPERRAALRQARRREEARRGKAQVVTKAA
ncbi:WhiB family transcriptional regulator [Streptomyces sp. NPDC088847]|uniref:WhiB family transcriptional regulator n=1 Tax=Streptomyces sp. NPDC088847 TaxID=3365909 RepID=UPI0038149B2D